MENQLMDETANPEEEVIQSSSVEHIISILNRLPEKLRTAVVMRDIQDLTYDLIAESMDMPLNTVKVYIHRGRKMLARQLFAETMDIPLNTVKVYIHRGRKMLVKQLLDQSEHDLEAGFGYEVQ
jgi:DNA-directed RNA polymerase specialized sigma24 family protein